MSEGLNEEMLDETVRDGIMSELHLEEEFAAERFASALDSAERGHPLDQRDLEDAALAPMVNAAGLLRRTWNAITPDVDYFTRSRSTILAAMPQRAEESEMAVSLLKRLWRVPVLAPIASASAAAVITLAFAISMLDGSGSTVAPIAVVPAPAKPDVLAETFIPPEIPADELVGLLAPDLMSRTARSIDAELSRIASALRELLEQSQRGELLEISLLRTITESTTSIARQIDASPEAMDRGTVLSYVQTVADGQATLRSLRVVPGTTAALAAALNATRDGVVSGGTYLLRHLSE